MPTNEATQQYTTADLLREVKRLVEQDSEERIKVLAELKELLLKQDILPDARETRERRCSAHGGYEYSCTSPGPCHSHSAFSCGCALPIIRNQY